MVLPVANTAKYELMLPSQQKSMQLADQTEQLVREGDVNYGKIGSTQVEFSEIHAEYKTEYRDSKGRRRVNWHTIFKGLLFSVDFNKHFNVLSKIL